MDLYNLYIQDSEAIFASFCSASNTLKSLNTNVSIKSVDTFITNYCRIYDIKNFKFKQEFNGTFTFKNNKCVESPSITLWELPNIKYRLTIEDSTYDSIVNNALIFLKINSIQINFDELFWRCFVFACMMIIKTHHIKRTKAKTYYSNNKIYDVIVKCIANLLYRKEDLNELSNDVMKCNINNTKANHNSNVYTTISTEINAGEKHSITNSVKYKERNNTVIKIYNENNELSLRSIAKLYEENTGEKINPMTVRTIISNVRNS